jgi:hypothetical protein
VDATGDKHRGDRWLFSFSIPEPCSSASSAGGAALTPIASA